MKLIFNSPPQAQARPRKGKWGFYNPKSDIQTKIRREAIKQLAHKGILTPTESTISISLRVWVPLPKKTPKKRLKSLLGKPANKRPDLDNYVKFYLDVLNGVLYRDDKQVTKIFSEKLYGEKGRVEIISSSHSECVEDYIKNLSKASLKLANITKNLLNNMAFIYLSLDKEKIKEVAEESLKKYEEYLF